MSKRVDISGHRYGRLVAIKRAETRNALSYWHCRCECGAEKVVRYSNLVSGGTVSCGCATAERRAAGIARKHSHTSRNGVSPTWKAWRSMRDRCTRESHRSWKDYGARGIRVCDRWGSFEVFLADMGERPSPAHSLDRIDVNAHYEPSNCRWATMKEQHNNTRFNHVLEIDGVSRTLAEWAEHSGILAATIRQRVGRGWSPKRAITEPPMRRGA